MSYYKIVRENSEYELQDKVREMMEKGWVPIGGVATEYIGGITGNKFLQAMVESRV